MEAMGTKAEIQLVTEEVSRFQRLFPNPECEEGHPATKNSLQHSQG